MDRHLWGSGKDFATVARLLHAADEDALESAHGYRFSASDHYAAGLPGSTKEFEHTRYQSWLDHGELLKQLGFQLDNIVMSGFVFSVMISSQKIHREFLAVMLSVFIKLGGDVNSVDEFGMQPLYRMMCYSSTKEKNHNFTALGVALLQNGADPCALDSLGRSLLDWAEQKNLIVKWYEILEEAGFDVREVEREIEARQWCYYQGGAYVLSTGVDQDDVAAPSIEGLSLRRAIVGDRLDE